MADVFEILRESASVLRRELGIPSPRGWTVESRRIDFTRNYPSEGNMLMVEHMFRHLADLDMVFSIIHQAMALAEHAMALAGDRFFDFSLTLAIAYRESGPLILSTSRVPIETYGRGGLDHLGAQIPALRGSGYIPADYGRGWHPLSPRELLGRYNELSRPIHPARVPRNELLVAYGAVIHNARDVFIREASARGLDVSILARRALRAWIMIFFAAPGGRAFSSREGVIGGITVLGHLEARIRQGRATGLNDILTDHELVRYQIVKRGRVSAGEAELIDQVMSMDPSRILTPAAH